MLKHLFNVFNQVCHLSKNMFDHLFISLIEKYLANTFRGSENRETRIIIQAVSKELLEHVGTTFKQNNIF